MTNQSRLPQQLDTEAGLDRLEYEIAREVSSSLFCSIVSIDRFADRTSTGYRLTCDRTLQQFWIWGPDRPMTPAEIQTNFSQQIAANLCATC